MSQIVTCEGCQVQFTFGSPQKIVNNDGTTTFSIEDVVVLSANADASDYDHHLFHDNLCASEWAMRKGYRLQRPSTWPARYYEAINEEPDEMLRPVVQDQRRTDQAAKMPKSRLS